MGKKQLTVDGLNVTIEKGDYISITDIAKRNSKQPRFVIQNWLKNVSTIRYLYEWERIHNPAINRVHLHTVLETGSDNRLTMSPAKWIKLINAIGLKSKTGRNGGTFAHKDIALNFCYWLDPLFQIYLIKEFDRLKEQEFNALESGREWHISKITDYVDSARQLLDTIPGQLPERNRIAGYLEEE